MSHCRSNNHGSSAGGDSKTALVVATTHGPPSSSGRCSIYPRHSNESAAGSSKREPAARCQRITCLARRVRGSHELNPSVIHSQSQARAARRQRDLERAVAAPSQRPAESPSTAACRGTVRESRERASERARVGRAPAKARGPRVEERSATAAAAAAADKQVQEEKSISTCNSASVSVLSRLVRRCQEEVASVRHRACLAWAAREWDGARSGAAVRHEWLWKRFDSERVRGDRGSDACAAAKRRGAARDVRGVAPPRQQPQEKRKQRG